MMKLTSIEKKAKQLGYTINREEIPFKGMYTKENLIKVKCSIENDRYYMTWDATAEENENLAELETCTITLNNKKDPNDAMTDYFTSSFYDTIKHAFLSFER